MNADELQRLATAMDIEIQASSTAPELIQAIQIAEGNSPCYQSAIAPVCGLEDCLWRELGCVSGTSPLL
jgi:hypothetical protein